MVDTIHVWQEKQIIRDGFVTIAATFELPNKTRTHLWYRLSDSHSNALAQTCDPFLAGYIFYIMRHADKCIVHGQVSPSFLRNLEEFQTVWACWRPAMYRQVEMTADVEQEPSRANHPDRAVLAFSGGVDSAFSAWRHRSNRCGRQRQNLVAGVFVRGLNVEFDTGDKVDRVAAKLEKMLSSINMALVPIGTNLRQVSDQDNWWDAHVAVAASCLMVLAGGYSAGMIGSSYPYQALKLPWGSNPITDNLLSSDTFPIILDGPGFTRPQKVRELANWKEGLQYLHVCDKSEHRVRERNCGQCSKCKRTILDFRSVGLDLPQCFEHDVSILPILSYGNPREVYFIPEILDAIKANRISGSWVWALYVTLWKSRIGLTVRKILRLNYRRKPPLIEHRANVVEATPCPPAALV